MTLSLSFRRKIFYTLVVLFIIAGCGAAAYAQGWQFDFSTWRFQKTGGIYLRAFPENAFIYINGTPTKNHSGFLSPGTLILNLLPATYQIALTAPGYDDWHEAANVQPALAAQFNNAVLIPANGMNASATTVTALTQSVSPMNGFSLPTSFSATGTQIFSPGVFSNTDPYNTALRIIDGKNKISLFDESQATTTVSSTISGKIIMTGWISSDEVGFVQSDGECYTWNIADDSLQKVADDVTSFAATNDGNSLATLEQAGLEVFSPSAQTPYYRFNLPDIANIRAVIWYRDNTHLFIVYNDNVSFLDFADSDLENLTSIASGTDPVYDARSNTLYMKSASGQFVQYEFPM